MKKWSLVLICFLSLFCTCIPNCFAKSGSTDKKEASNKEIQWLSFDELQVAMKKNPKKVFMDVYTDWCGWCKKMEKSTFTNPEVIKYINEHYWNLTLPFGAKDIVDETISYQYFIKNADGTISYDWGGNDKSFNPSKIKAKQVLLNDSWNAAGYYENAFYTEPFKNVLLKNSYATTDAVAPKITTHLLKVKSPLLTPTQTICLLGDTRHLRAWDAKDPILLSRKDGEDYFSVSLDLSKATFPISYKYGVYDVVKKSFVVFENGSNRMLVDAPSANKLIVVNDGFTYLPNDTWKGAGVAIPVFSLRSNNGLGVGEFTDIKLLVDWAKKVGLKKISSKDKGFIVVQSDMPFIKLSDVNKIYSSIKLKRFLVHVLKFKNRVGNPIGFDISILKKFKKIRGDVGAKFMVKRLKSQTKFIKINSVKPFKDFDKASDFRD